MPIPLSKPPAPPSYEPDRYEVPSRLPLSGSYPQVGARPGKAGAVPPMFAPPEPPPLPPVYALPAPRVARTQAKGVPAPIRDKFIKRRPAKTWVAPRDNTLVLGAVFVFAVTGLVVAGTQSLGAFAQGRSREALEAALNQVYAKQSDFHLMHQRYATWPELEARGARLAPTQTVLRANASASHWFMSLFDRETGVVCDQTGELFDEEAGERRPSCRPHG